MNLTQPEHNMTLVAVPRRYSDQKHCYSCSILIHSSALSCPGCGAMQPEMMANKFNIPATISDEKKIGQIPPNHVYCRGCGQPIHAQATSCPKCGAPQNGNIASSLRGRKDRVSAALFAFLLGGIGGHKFYLRQFGLGILYLLFFWTFIPAAIAFIEGIIYLTKTDSEFSQIYG